MGAKSYTPDRKCLSRILLSGLFLASEAAPEAEVQVPTSNVEMSPR